MRAQILRTITSVLIPTSFVHQHDEEMNKLKKERRPGRPASTREDILKVKIAADEKEYRDGFCWYLLPNLLALSLQLIDLPDLMDADNVVYLDRWDGVWSYLSTLKWVRIQSDGTIHPTKFPPKGQA